MFYTGANAPSSSYRGGGSGGSIIITAYNMSGHGVLDVSGGNGYNNNGGGGSGGRMAIEITYDNKYGGDYNTQGGNSGSTSSDQKSKYTGASGTVYKYESNSGPQYRERKYNPLLNRTMVEPEHIMLVVNNSIHNTIQPTVIMNNTNQYTYEFDVLQIEGYSYVWLHQASTTRVTNMKVKELTGNKKGYLVSRAHQRFQIHYVESTHAYLDAPCGFVVEKGSEVVLPDQMIVLAETFHLKGGMTGVKDLSVERSATFQMSEDAHTKEPSTLRWYENQKDPNDNDYTSGLIDVDSLTVNNDGELKVTMPDTMVPRFEVPNVDVKNGGLINIECYYTHMNGSNLVIEKGGTLEGDGGGYPYNTGTGKGKFKSILKTTHPM